MKKVTALLLVIAFIVLSCPLPTNASTTLEELKKAQEEKKKTEQQLNDTQEDLKNLQGIQDSLKVELSSLNTELKEVSNNLADLEEKIKIKQEEIETTTEALNEAKAIEAWQYDCMKKRIKFMYERGEFAMMEMFLEAENFSEYINKSEYIAKITEYDRKMLKEYQATRDEIAAKEQELIEEKEALDALQEAVEKEQQRVTGLVNRTNGNIKEYGNQISAAEQAALEYEAAIKEQENNIAALRKQYEAELALSQLAANSVWRDISQVSFAEGDRYLLASIIYCEAGGEPYAGKLAVGSVVINRLLSSRYPDTVVGVIYQNKQFSPVASGRLAIALAEGKATASCYQAADEAMSGRSNVENCLYFRTPIEGIVPRYQIGGHIFY